MEAEVFEVFTVESRALPATARVLAFTGREALSELYRFELHVLIPHADSLALDPRAVMHARASLIFHRADGAERTRLHGVIAELELLHELPGDALYKLVLVPGLWQLGLSCHSTIFVDATTPAILAKVLARGGLAPADFELRLAGTYPAREHVCQYRESDLAFVARWMEREGMAYHFEHGADREKLVITDSKAFVAPFVPTPVRFDSARGGESSGREALASFTCTRRTLATSVRVTDYDYLHPALAVTGTAAVTPRGVGEVRVYGDNALTPAESRRLATVRAQELSCREVVFRGRGRTFDLRAGYAFELDEHPRAAFNARYLAVALTHRGNQYAMAPEARALIEPDAHASTDASTAAGATPDEAVYVVAVTAIPQETQFRPVRATPWPRIDGLEPAVVDGAGSGPYAQIDAHGRYLVSVFFDEGGAAAGNGSTRVRMLQPHGGNPEGLHFPLRKGTEVALGFVGGDPDLPMIVGVGPNPLTPSPVEAGDPRVNVFQSAARNRLELRDDVGAPHVFLTSPPENTFLHMGAPRAGFNAVLQTDGTSLHQTGGNHVATVGGTKTEQVTGNVTRGFDSDYSATTAGNHTRQTNGNVTSQTGGDEAHTTVGNVSDTTLGSAAYTTVGNFTQTVVGDYLRQVQGSRSDLITGNLSETNLADVTSTTTGSVTTTTLGNVTTTTQGDVTDMTLGVATTTTIGARRKTIVGATADTVLAANLLLAIGPVVDTYLVAHLGAMVGGVAVAANLGVTVDLCLGGLISAHASVAIENHMIKLKDTGSVCHDDCAALRTISDWISDGLELFT